MARNVTEPDTKQAGVVYEGLVNAIPYQCTHLSEALPSDELPGRRKNRHACECAQCTWSLPTSPLSTYLQGEGLSFFSANASLNWPERELWSPVGSDYNPSRG